MICKGGLYPDPVPGAGERDASTMNRLVKVMSTFFGAGYFPLAPGTFASLAAVALYRFVLAGLSGPIFAGVIIGVYLLGVAAAGSFSRLLGERDPRKIVIDEVVGQWIALFLIPPSWLNLALAFFFFRVFDIIKPFGIRDTERLPGGWGIMTDDVVAGLAALLLVRLSFLVR
jgi:phosphatidylglycerophosphatase A